MEDTITVSEKPTVGGSEDTDSRTQSRSIEDRLRSTFTSLIENRQEEDAVKIDSDWKYEKTWTRMKGESKTAERATTFEEVLQAISFAFELLSNQRTRGSPEYIKLEVMQ